MIFSGIVRTSLIDYPGKIATVLFTPGCNFNCFFCHNRRLIEDIEEILDMNDIEQFLKKRQGLIDAVVITGGEPTLQKGLIPFFLHLKEMGYLTKLDSNGSNPEIIQACIEENAVDYFAIDYKAPASRYDDITRTGHFQNKVMESIEILLRTHQSFEVRTTVIPQLSLSDLIQMSEELPEVPRYVLNPYKVPDIYLASDQEWIDVPPYSEKQIAEFAETLKLYQPNIVLLF